MAKVKKETGVEYQRYSSGTYVGVRAGRSFERHFKCGAYSFSNVFSANMFSYLSRSVGGENAKSVVIAFEEKTTGSAAGREALKTIVGIVEWELLLTGNAPGAAVATLKNAVSTACHMVLGSAVMSQLEKGYGGYNPYPPIKDGILWVGDSANSQYIDYAFKYWRLHPLQGPAYVSSSSLVRPKS